MVLGHKFKANLSNLTRLWLKRIIKSWQGRVGIAQ